MVSFGRPHVPRRNESSSSIRPLAADPLLDIRFGARVEVGVDGCAVDKVAAGLDVMDVVGDAVVVVECSPSYRP